MLKSVQRNYEEISSLDQAERDQIVMELLPQVRYIARRIHDRLPPQVLLEDLVNAGIVGLLEAIRDFDPSKKAQIKTYAKIRIQGAILDSLRDLDWSPRKLRRQSREIEHSSHKLSARLGRMPTEAEIAADLKMGLEDLQHLLSELRGLDLGSLQALASEEGQEEDFHKYLPNGPEEDPYYICAQSEMRQCLARAVGELTERERQLLALYYVEELTMKEVGAVLGLGEGRISQIHSSILLRLRSRMQELLAPRSPQRDVETISQGVAAWRRY